MSILPTYQVSSPTEQKSFRSGFGWLSCGCCAEPNEPTAAQPIPSPVTAARAAATGNSTQSDLESKSDYTCLAMELGIAEEAYYQQMAADYAATPSFSLPTTPRSSSSQNA